MSIIHTSPVVILCCCVKDISVEELKRQIVLPKLIASVAKEINDSFETEDENNQNFRKSYQACICFYRKLKAKAQAGMKWIVFLYFN